MKITIANSYLAIIASSFDSLFNLQRTKNKYMWNT